MRNIIRLKYNRFEVIMILKKISDFLRGSDLKRTQHYFAIRNETSGIKLSNFETVTPSEFGHNFLILKVPKKTCQKGQKLIINIFDNRFEIDQIKKRIKSNNYKESLEIYTRVEDSVEENDFQNITLFFLEIEEHKWKNFINLYKNVQIKISKLSSPLSPDLDIEDEDEDEDKKEAS